MFKLLFFCVIWFSQFIFICVLENMAISYNFTFVLTLCFQNTKLKKISLINNNQGDFYVNLNYLTAITEISTFTSNGNLDT